MNQNSTVSTNSGKYLKTFVIFFLLFALLTKIEAISWNDTSRMAQIQSFVERGTLIIDNSIFFDTGDKYFFNNHFYSDKPPLLALYASPFYFFLKKLGLSFESNSQLTYYLTTLLSIGSLSALGLTVFRKILQEFLHASNEWADIITFITGTGTLILPYSLIFNNHIPSGVLILIGFYYLLNYKRNSKLKDIFYSGFFFSCAVTIDIGCFLFIPLILIYFLTKSLKAGLTFAISCTPMIAIYLFLNLYTSGSFIPPAMNASLWDYPESSFNQESLSGLATHNNVFGFLFYGFHMLLGNRGLLSHNPILLLSIIGLLIIIYQKNLRVSYKAEYIYILFISLLYVGIYIFRTTNYSGSAFGVRWFASLMLILCLPMAYVEGKFKSSKSLKFIFISIMCLSIFISLVGAYNPFSHLAGETMLQEQLSPTNTIIANIKLFVADFFATTSIEKKLFQLFLEIRLILGTFIIYFWFFRLIGNFRNSGFFRNSDC